MSYHRGFCIKNDNYHLYKCAIIKTSCILDNKHNYDKGESYMICKINEIIIASKVIETKYIQKLFIYLIILIKNKEYDPFSNIKSIGAGMIVDNGLLVKFSDSEYTFCVELAHNSTLMPKILDSKIDIIEKQLIYTRYTANYMLVFKHNKDIHGVLLECSVYLIPDMKLKMSAIHFINYMFIQSKSGELYFIIFKNKLISIERKYNCVIFRNKYKNIDKKICGKFEFNNQINESLKIFPLIPTNIKSFTYDGTKYNYLIRKKDKFPITLLCFNENERIISIKNINMFSEILPDL